MRYTNDTPENLSCPGLTPAQQLEWLYEHKESLLQAGANIRITRSGNTTTIEAVGEGFSPTVAVEEAVNPITGVPGHKVTITDGEGEHIFYVWDGAPGQDGTDGTDGTSVSFSTQSIQGGTRVFLEDGTHSSSFDVMDGLDGEDITITDVTTISSGIQVTFSDDTTIVVPNGLTGPQGQPGLDGRNVFIKYADAQPTQDSDMKDIPSAFMGVYSGTATTAPTAYTDYLWYQIKGTKGDTGNQGPSGVSPSLSSEPISGGHRVTMVDAQGSSYFDVMDGENAAAATVTVGSTTTGQPGTNASVTNSGTSSDAVLDFVIPRGNPGPAAYVWTTDDDYTTPNYTFDIADLDGVSGETPKVGDIIFQNVNHRTFLFKINTVSTTTVLTDYFCEITGATGQDGTTPAISATATADATSSATPTVTVTKSGTDAQPSFAFAFSGLKGATGAAGQGVPAGGTGNQVLSKINATDYNAEWKTIGLIPTGGTSGQVLTKTGSSNYQMSWSTPTGRLPDYPYGALVADAMGTAVWLGPNDVDPTTDIGKVLTLKDVAESGMPPIIIPQWETAGGGSGSGMEEWVDVTNAGRMYAGTVLYYQQNSASSTSSSNISSYSHQVFMRPVKVGSDIYHAVKIYGEIEVNTQPAPSNFIRADVDLGSGFGFSYDYQGVTYTINSSSKIITLPSSFVYQGGNNLSKYTTCGSVYYNTENAFPGNKLRLSLGFPAVTNGAMAARIYFT